MDFFHVCAYLTTLVKQTVKTTKVFGGKIWTKTNRDIPLPSPDS